MTIRIDYHCGKMWRACIIGSQMNWKWWPNPTDHHTKNDAEIGARELIRKFLDGVVWC